MSPLCFGTPSILEFKLQWEHTELPDTPMAATRGWLGVTVADGEVWKFAGPPTESWPWIELLEYLGRYWRFIEHEIGSDPLGLDVRPDKLRSEAEKLWDDVRDEERDAEEVKLLGYLRSHDLSHALRGALAPELFVIRRSENTARITAHGRDVEVDWAKVERAFVWLGDAIAVRIQHLTDNRSVAAKQAWLQRSPTLDNECLAIRAGGSEEDASSFVQALQSSHFKSATDVLPFAVAARMIPETMGLLDLLPFFQAVSGEHRSTTSQRLASLRADAKAVRKDLEGQGRLRYKVGHELARWYRRERGINPESQIDIDDQLRELDISVYNADVRTGEVDALCMFGGGKSPTVVVNINGDHARGRLGRRATLCHELCHLLVDLGVTMPLAEAKSLRAPKGIEQRANAFAAELLCPQAIASCAKLSMKTDTIEQTVHELSGQFGASEEIVLWQLIQAPGTPDSEIMERLVQMVQSRSAREG